MKYFNIFIRIFWFLSALVVTASQTMKLRLMKQ